VRLARYLALSALVALLVLAFASSASQARVGGQSVCP